jgi:hypothetical protein
VRHEKHTSASARGDAKHEKHASARGGSKAHAGLREKAGIGKGDGGEGQTASCVEDVELQMVNWLVYGAVTA